MKQRDKGEEKLESGLLQKYVLGICEPEERDHIEKLAATDHKIARLIDNMKKAMHCYCTSCHSDKVKSIHSTTKVANSSHCAGIDKDQKNKLVTLPPRDQHVNQNSLVFRLIDKLKVLAAKILGTPNP
jgi:anti-sigma-K factor RskA